MLKDQKQMRVQALERALKVCSLQVTQSESQEDELASVVPLAKSPRERTSMNIVLDDQRKVIKALKRMHADVSEILEKELVLLAVPAASPAGLVRQLRLSLLADPFSPG